MTDFHIRNSCRLCDGPIRKVFDLGATPIANEYPRYDANADCFEAAGKRFTRAGGQDKFPLFLAQCESCGHVQLPVVVDPKRLFPPSYPYQSGTSPVFRAHLKEFAATVSGLIPKGGNVLEIASNDGTLLKEFDALDHPALGIDPAAPSDDPDAIREFFTHALAKDLRSRAFGFDAIVALNVFAHCDDLNDFTAGVAELLAPDGVFVFEVGYLPDVIAKGLVGVCYHEHASYHHLWPLFTFFERHGLIICDAHRIDSQGGSIRAFVRRAESGAQRTGSVRELYREEADSGWRTFAGGKETHHFLPGLAETIDHKRAELVDWLHKHKLHGKKVAAFGAPAKLTTWCYALGLTGADISVVYDDNELKQGRFTPGTLIPIVPSSQLLTDKPDALILFSSNFEAEIRERFKAYRGEWIVL